MKYLLFELLKLKGSHIKEHSGFEEAELDGELNCELGYRSRSAKVGMGRNLWTTSACPKRSDGVMVS